LKVGGVSEEETEERKEKMQTLRYAADREM
jgi:hypothetical protein